MKGWMSAIKNDKWQKNIYIKSNVPLCVQASYVTIGNIYFILVNTSLFSVHGVAVTLPQSMWTPYWCYEVKTPSELYNLQPLQMTPNNFRGTGNNINRSTYFSDSSSMYMEEKEMNSITELNWWLCWQLQKSCTMKIQASENYFRFHKMQIL
jgi:hypothetical protein